MQFAVRAFRRLDPITLTLEAGDTAEARAQAEAQGLSVIEVRPRSRVAAWRSGRSRAFPLAAFNQSLLLLLEAGLSVVEALETLGEREARPDTRRILLGLLARLREGLTLSAALERHAGAFPALYVATVRANERSGGLAEAIRRYSMYRAQAERLRQRVVGASIYPLMILMVGALVVGFLLAYVVPRFALVFQDLGESIPAASRLLLEWGRFVRAHGWLLLAALSSGVGAVVAALRTPPLRLALVRSLLRLPRIGALWRTYELARLYRALGMLHAAGIPILAALDMARGLLPHALQSALAASRQEVAAGRALSDAFEAHGLATPVALRLLRVAEQTGRLGDLLERSAAFHEDEVAQAIDWFLRLFEPLLMVAIGIVIGLVVLLMYAPIFELAGSLQ